MRVAVSKLWIWGCLFYGNCTACEQSSDTASAGCEHFLRGKLALSCQRRLGFQHKTHVMSNGFRKAVSVRDPYKLLHYISAIIIPY
jgi:hypothetical protein